MLSRFLAGFMMAAALGVGQQKPDFAGDFSGALGPIHIKLHLTAGRDGVLTGTVDSPDQGLTGVPCTDFQINGQALSFNVPIVHGTWMGFLSADGASLTGMWNRGNPVPLNFTRGAANPTSPAANGTPPSRGRLPAGASEVKWDDYTFKFTPGGTMAQVFEGNKVSVRY
jgi:hypothetical protein